MNLRRPRPLYSEHVLTCITKVMNEGLLIINDRNMIEAVNAAAVRMLGYASIDQVEGKPLREIYQSSEACKNFLDEFNALGAIEYWESTFLRVDGSTAGITWTC